jgi:hypothetical protein
MATTAKVGQQHPLNCLPCSGFNRTHRQLVDRSYQRNRLARMAGPPGPSDTMNVVIRRHRNIVIDYMRDRINIDAARRNVGRNQHAMSSILEATQGGFTLWL